MPGNHLWLGLVLSILWSGMYVRGGGEIRHTSWFHVEGALKTLQICRGGRTRLPKFKFSANFPIGLHVILQIQIKKFENDCYIIWNIILTENPSRFNVEPLLK